jgi:hypothetical protein
MSDSKWCQKFKMVANFQWGVFFFLLNTFSIALLRCVCVENEKKSWKKFLYFVTRWRHSPKGLVRNGFYAITWEVFNFFSICFCFRFLWLVRKLCGRKVFEKFIVCCRNRKFIFFRLL